MVLPRHRACRTIEKGIRTDSALDALSASSRYSRFWDFAGGTAPTLTTTAAAVDRVDYVILDSSNIHAVATLDLS